MFARPLVSLRSGPSMLMPIFFSGPPALPAFSLSSFRWFSGGNSGAASASSVIEIRDENHFMKEVAESDKPVVTVFHASWCRPCKVLEPVLEAAHQEFKDTVKMVRVDIDQLQRVAMSQPFQVSGVPAGFLVHNRQVHDRFMGVISAEQARQLFEKASSLSGT